jgi:hypothetical protein
MRRATLSVLAFVLVSTLVPLSAFAHVTQQGDCRTFSETGNSVCGKFLAYWTGHGGLAQQGYPLSGTLEEVSATDGKTYTVQYFERAIFEAHPENAAPNDILLSLLGVFLYQSKYPNGAPAQEANNEAGSVAFAETGKRVGGRFLDYWKAHGGLAQQGLPISDEFVETSDLDGKPYRVQYFERAVFEYHPEQQPAYQVLLSQLGTFRFRDKYGAGAVLPTAPVPSAATPEPTSAPAPTSPPGSGEGHPSLSCAAAEGEYCAAAAVSNPTPAPGSVVRVTGRLMKGSQPVQGAVMTTVWHYKSKNTPCDGAKTDVDGYAGCSNPIGQATVGYRVQIDVSFSVDGVVVASTATEFTPDNY